MQGAIRNVESLKKWFFANGKPFFTLSYAAQQTQVIQRNTVVETMEDAWSLLEMAVTTQAEYGRATLHVIVYDKDKSNNPAARTNIDVLPNQAITGFPQMYQGIGYLPAPHSETNVEAAIAAAREKWEMQRQIDDLKAEINAKADPTDLWLDRIGQLSQTPLGMALIAKFTGAAAPMPVAMPQPQVAGHQTDNTDEDLDNELDALEVLAGQNGISLKAFLAKTVAMAQAYPAVVQQIANG